jgi:hypothetical protein
MATSAEWIPNTGTSTSTGTDYRFHVGVNTAATNATDSLRSLEQRIKELSERAEGLSDASFQARFNDLANRYPAMPLRRAYELLNGLTDEELDDTEKVAKWILEQPELVALLENKKINAIKETRARTYLGLKQAKEAVEMAADLKRHGWMSEAEKKQLEEETRAAIESIQAVRLALERCPRCGHAPHQKDACYNLASDNDCECSGV